MRCTWRIASHRCMPFGRVRIYEQCRPQDFCVFKLDIDYSAVEVPIVMQILENPGDPERDRIGRIEAKKTTSVSIHGTEGGTGPY